MVFSVGAIAAPLMGGALTEKTGWRWCFWVNLPVGVPVFGVLVVVLRLSDGKRSMEEQGVWAKISSLDLPDAGLLLAAAVVLFYALQRAAEGISWNSPLIIGLLVGTAVVTLTFAAWQGYQGDQALIIPRILKQRTVFAAGVANIAMYAALIVYIYFLPIYFQAIRGASIVGSAVDLLPLFVTCSLSSIGTGVLATKVGYFAPPAVVGLCLTMIGAGLVTTIDEGTSMANLVLYHILLSAGLGLALQAGFFGVQAVLASKEIAIGTSLMTFCQSLGGALGVSVGNAVLRGVLRGHREELLQEGVNVDDVIAAGATAFRAFLHGRGLEGLLAAYSHALKQVWILAAALTGLALLAACFMELRKATERPIPSPSESTTTLISEHPKHPTH